MNNGKKFCDDKNKGGKKKTISARPEGHGWGFHISGEQLNKLILSIIFLSWMYIHLPLFVPISQMPFLTIAVGLLTIFFNITK